MMEYLSFTWTDYILFVLLFLISICIGAYYGFCTKQKQTTSEYLLGGKRLKVLPVSISLTASTLSGITLLSIPAEIYVHGTQYMLIMITPPFLYFVLNYIYLPIFFKLKLGSLFEYLEIRFDRRMHIMASSLFTINMIFYMPLVIYAPSLAFNQVTGINLHLIAVIMSAICIFYTALGGLKAVVWADTLQFCFTLCTLSYLIIVGIISVGGISEIWKKAEEGDRLEFFNMNPDPRIRNSFWTIIVGLNIMWITFSITNPGLIQRYLAVPTLKDSRRVLIIFVLFKIITIGICSFSGLIIYAKYYKCDPISTRQITKSDQLLSFYVMDVSRQLPGLSGLFVAGLFSTALSTLSTSLNALSGTIYQDFVSQFMPSNTTEKAASASMKIITVILGVISVSMVFVINKLGTVIELVSTLNGSTLGPLGAIFTLGVMLPIANKKGVFIGSAVSLLVMIVVTMMYQIHVWNGNIKYKPKPLYTHGCNDSAFYLNNSYTTTDEENPDEIHWLFKISVHYYVGIGMILTIVIGLFASWLSKNDQEAVNLDTICPFIKRYFLLSKATTRYTLETELNHLNSNEFEFKENHPLKGFVE